MLSKQKKRGKAPKQVIRTAGSRAAPNRRVKSKSLPTRSREQKRLALAPAAGSVVRRNFYGFSFGAAAPHDEFPEGGLRISGMLPGTSSSGSVVNDTVSEGCFGTGGLPAVAVDPCGSTIGTGVGALFSFTGPLATFAQFFRRYRFRALTAVYNGTIPTSDTGNKLVQIAYERDAFTGAGTTYTITNAVTAQTARFNAWVPEVVIPLIVPSREGRDDELFWTGVAGDGMSALLSADLRQRFQGCITCMTTSVAAADKTFGNVIYRFSVDLYGFTNAISTGVPSRKRPEELSLRAVSERDKGDSKEHDFVELTPKSRRVAETPPPSVRVSSRKN
jgi:hypothetical protein